MKQLDGKKILYGAHIGEHGFDKDLIIKEIEENCLSRGMNFVTIRTPKMFRFSGHYIEKSLSF